MSLQTSVVTLLASLLLSVALVSLAQAGEPVSEKCKAFGEYFHTMALARDLGVSEAEIGAQFIKGMRAASPTGAIDTMDVSLLMANLKRVYVTHRDRTPAQWRQ